MEANWGCTNAGSRTEDKGANFVLPGGGVCQTAGMETITGVAINNVGIVQRTRHIYVEFPVKPFSGATAAISNALNSFPESEVFISIREVAWRSSMSEKTIRNFIRNAALPHFRNTKSGKIWLRWSEFVEWMEHRRIELKKDDCLLDILRDMTRKATQ